MIEVYVQNEVVISFWKVKPQTVHFRPVRFFTDHLCHAHGLINRYLNSLWSHYVFCQLGCTLVLSYHLRNTKKQK